MNHKKNEEILQETALKDFLYLSEQRLKFIRFYISIVVLIISALSIVLLKSNDLISLITSFALEVFLMSVSWIFLRIDKRNEELIKITKGALKFYEVKCKKENDLCIFSKEVNSSNSLGTSLNMLFIGGFVAALFFMVITIIKIVPYTCPVLVVQFFGTNSL